MMVRSNAFISREFHEMLLISFERLSSSNADAGVTLRVDDDCDPIIVLLPWLGIHSVASSSSFTLNAVNT